MNKPHCSHSTHHLNDCSPLPLQEGQRYYRAAADTLEDAVAASLLLQSSHSATGSSAAKSNLSEGAATILRAWAPHKRHVVSPERGSGTGGAAAGEDGDDELGLMSKEV